LTAPAMGILAQIAIYSKRMLQAKPTLLVSDNDILKKLSTAWTLKKYVILFRAAGPSALSMAFDFY